jgi:long-chain acyl-CoA synthetase
MKTIPDVFRAQAQRAGTKECIRLHGDEAADAAIKTLTYAQLYALLVNKSALYRKHFGLKPGATVALMADNSLDYLVAVYSAIFAGLGVLVISTKSLPEHLAYFVKRSEAGLLLCSGAYRDACQQVLTGDMQLADLALFAPAANELNIDDAALQDFERTPAAATDTAVILHTSGTTRTPKLVYLSHRNILANQLASDGAFRQYWTGDETSLGWLPLYHGYALMAEFLRDMLTGSRYVLFLKSGQVTAETLLAAIEETGTTLLCCVPWMLNLLQDKIRAEGDSGPALKTLQKLKFIVTGGSNLGSGLGDFYRERDVRVVTMFGLSEAAGFVLHSPFDGSAWDEMKANAHEGVEFIPVDSSNREHELVITRSDLFSGKVLFPPGETDPQGGRARLETGDLFLRKGQGWTYLGRGDQIYNGAHGEKVNPLLFELGLEQFEAVQKVFVFGEELSFNVALVKLKPGRITDAAVVERMKAFVQETLNPKLENPDRVYPGDLYLLGDDEAMPLTPKGTVNRKEAARILQKLIAARANPTVEGVADAGAVSDIFRRELHTYVKDDKDVDFDGATLLELGFDSLMTLSLRNNLQEKLKLQIPIDLMLSYPPLRAFEQALIDLNTQVLQGGGAGKAAANNRDRSAWRGIGLEQVIFHKAYYLFPGPTFGGSFSLVAPRRLTAADVEQGLRFVERNHEVLRSIYRPDGTFRIADYSMISRAFIAHVEMSGSHDLNENLPVQDLIQGRFALEHYNFAEGPAWRYATVDITNDAGETRTMLFIGINHIIGDFRTFSLMVREFMLYLDGAITEADVVPDDYLAVLTSATPEQIKLHQDNMQLLLTTGLDQLPKGGDLRQGARLRFNFRDIDMAQLSNALRAHNLSVFNGVYAAWVFAASRYIDGLTLEDFPSVTSVTTRISKELETVMGCFVYTPLYCFSLDASDSMKSAAAKVQKTTLEAFKGVLINPAGYFEKALADPRNLMPIIKRNIVLYRSPDELIEPVPKWGCYRNDYFEDRCNVGAYFDFCANKADGSMEGYLTVNLHFCSQQTARKVLDCVELLMKKVLQNPALDFRPAQVLADAVG